MSIKCYLQGNKQGYKNFIEAEKVSNSVVFLANQILCLSALNDRGIPCDHVKNDNVTVNWQWPYCFSEEKTAAVIPHNEMH